MKDFGVCVTGRKDSVTDLGDGVTSKKIVSHIEAMQIKVNLGMINRKLNLSPTQKSSLLSFFKDNRLLFITFLMSFLYVVPGTR